jgi:hypothetical protein
VPPERRAHDEWTKRTFKRSAHEREKPPSDRHFAGDAQSRLNGFAETQHFLASRASEPIWSQRGHQPLGGVETDLQPFFSFEDLRLEERAERDRVIVG